LKNIINEVKEAISDADNKKFTEFSKKVRTSLEDKLRNNPTIKAKAEELKSYEKMNKVFAQISSTPENNPQQDTISDED